MGISGFELFFFVTLIPFILGIQVIRRVVTRYSGYFHLFSLIGLCAYQFVSPVTRLIMLGLGIGTSTLVWSANLVKGVSPKKGLNPINSANSWHLMSWLLGLILCNIMKYGWYTNDPIWPIMHSENGGMNLTGLILGLLSCLENISREPETFPSIPSNLNDSLEETKDFYTFSKKTDLKTSDFNGISNPKSGWWRAALGLSGVMYGLHNILVDSSELCRWVVDGYPMPGPDPAIFGPVVMAAMGLGIYLSSLPSSSGLLSQGWWAIGTISSMGLYFAPKYFGFMFGLIWTVWLSAITPSLFAQIGKFPVGRTFAFGFFMYEILCLAGIWTVAYAFVPGGPYLRERTYLVVLIMQVFLWLGLSVSQPEYGSLVSSPLPQPISRPKTRAGSSTNLEGLLPFDHSLLSSSSSSSFSSSSPISPLTHRVKASLLFLFLLCLSFMIRRLSLWEIVEPHHPKDRIISGGIWTIHFGLDNEMWESHERMARLIRELELDVIGTSFPLFSFFPFIPCHTSNHPSINFFDF